MAQPEIVDDELAVGHGHVAGQHARGLIAQGLCRDDEVVDRHDAFGHARVEPAEIAVAGKDHVIGAHRAGLGDHARRSALLDILHERAFVNAHAGCSRPAQDRTRRPAGADARPPYRASRPGRPATDTAPASRPHPASRSGRSRIARPDDPHGMFRRRLAIARNRHGPRPVSGDSRCRASRHQGLHEVLRVLGKIPQLAGIRAPHETLQRRPAPSADHCPTVRHCAPRPRSPRAAPPAAPRPAPPRPDAAPPTGRYSPPPPRRHRRASRPAGGRTGPAALRSRRTSCRDTPRAGHWHKAGSWLHLGPNTRSGRRHRLRR